MESNLCAATLMESTASKIQQLQKAFAELESHRAVTLNFKWKQLEEHLYGLQKSVKRRFTELEEQEKDFDTKIAESKVILEKRKAAVLAKEQASLERLQVKRDAAVSAILTCIQKKRPFPGDSVDRDSESKVEATEPGSVVADGNFDFLKKRAKHFDVQVKSYPELVKLCREMNSEGLQKFISDNRKDLTTLRDEVPIALSASADPGTLVLETLKGFYGTEVPNFDAKKDSNLLGLRRTCIMLMESLGKLLIDQHVNYSYSEISENAKKGAKAIAENWKPKLVNLDAEASNGNSLEAHAFLLLLSTFGINSEFDQKSLFKLIPMVSRRRQTAELCHNLGLTEKLPGMIDTLIKNGRQIDAVNLAFTFELTDRFSPIPLLKSYLSESKKTSAPKSGNTSPSTSSQSDVNEKELIALKAVIKCIEDHKLEEKLPIEPLQKRIVEIEKAKSEKKRANEVAKPQSKRPRATTIPHQQPRASFIAPAEKNYHISGERYPSHYGYEMTPYAYMGTPAYTFSTSHPNFFGNAYQYQAGYLH